MIYLNGGVAGGATEFNLKSRGATESDDPDRPRATGGGEGAGVPAPHLPPRRASGGRAQVRDADRRDVPLGRRMS